MGALDFYFSRRLSYTVMGLPFCLSCAGIYSPGDWDNGNRINLYLDYAGIEEEDYMGREGVVFLHNLLRMQPYVGKCVVEREIDPAKYGAVDMSAPSLRRPYDIAYLYRRIRPTPRYYDLSRPWISAPVDAGRYSWLSGKALVWRTERNVNSAVDYRWLRGRESQAVFIGYESEYWLFQRDHGLEGLRYVRPKDFTELAGMLSSCRFCMGNQTFYFAMAESLKVPRILEMYQPFADMTPHGDMAFEALDAASMERLFDYCMANARGAAGLAVK